MGNEKEKGGMQARELRYAVTCAIVGTVSYIGYFLVFPETRVLQGVLMAVFFVAMGAIIQMMAASKTKKEVLVTKDEVLVRQFKKILMSMIAIAIIVTILFFFGASWGWWQVPIIGL